MKITHFFIGFLLLTIGFFLGKIIMPETPMEMKPDIQQNQELPAETGLLQNTGMSTNISLNSLSSQSENQVIQLFERVAPSVVFINTSQIAQSYWSLDVTEIPKGSGSGFMWDNLGHIVTNYHVIEGGERLTVTLSDQSTYEAKLIGIAPSKDLALLKINAPTAKLKPIPLASSANLKVGQFAYAIGNPFGFDQTLTSGVISALGREITARNNRKIYDVIQTDAAINPGNSGGPLLNSAGKLIGVNTAIFSPSGAYSGIGFSIPSNIVKKVIPDLIQFGEVRRAVIGINLLPEAYNVGEGAMVFRVIPNSPAQSAGLKGVSRDRSGGLIAGDFITKINDSKIKSNNDFVEVLENYQPGDVISIVFEREGHAKKVNIKLASSVNDN